MNRPASLYLNIIHNDGTWRATWCKKSCSLVNTSSIISLSFHCHIHHYKSKDTLFWPTSCSAECSKLNLFKAFPLFSHTCSGASFLKEAGSVQHVPQDWLSPYISINLQKVEQSWTLTVGTQHRCLSFKMNGFQLLFSPGLCTQGEKLQFCPAITKSMLLFHINDFSHVSRWDKRRNVVRSADSNFCVDATVVFINSCHGFVIAWHQYE